jgi:hypothetical protein
MGKQLSYSDTNTIIQALTGKSLSKVATFTLRLERS